MNAYELRRNYYRNHPDGHFFDYKTLRFFGERFSEMRVLKGTVKIYDGTECYVLSSLQRKHPCGPRRVYHYFDIETFDHRIDH